MFGLIFQGIFSSVIRDITGNKSKSHVPDHVETEDTRQSFKELETIFSTAKVPGDAERTNNMAVDEEEDELDIGTQFVHYLNLACSSHGDYYYFSRKPIM